MKINFEITNLPVKEQKRYITAYIEGTLKIFIEDMLFFNQPGILLVEFAIFARKWLDNIHAGSKMNFIYETMDYDDPILLIKYVKDNYYRIDSIWKEAEVTTLLAEEEIISEFEKYLSNLSDLLKIQLDVNLDTFIKNNRF